MNSFFIKLIDHVFRGERQPAGYAGQTDIGKVRKNNEDYYSIQGGGRLFLVADGMGGHKGGEVASRAAVESFLSFFSALLCQKISGNQEEIRHALIAAFHHSNKTVIDLATGREELKGMGCTMVACLVDQNTLHVCHVGDTRCYIADESSLRQITNDHTLMADRLRNGKNSDIPQKRMHNILTRAIGFPFPEDPEYHARPIKPGNKVLLCSDGLWNMVDDPIIHHALCESVTPEQGCRKLIRIAKKAGGLDNITALLIYN